MNEKELQGVVLRVVLTELARAGERFVPVSSSNVRKITPEAVPGRWRVMTRPVTVTRGAVCGFGPSAGPLNSSAQ